MGRIVCNEIDYSGSPLVTDSTPNASSVNPVTSAGVHKALVGQEELLKDTVGFTSKNLILFPYKESTLLPLTRDGITYTDNGNGTLKVDGTATALSKFRLIVSTDNPNFFKAGEKYIVSGGSSNVHLQVYFDATAKSIVAYQNEVTFTVEQADLANSWGVFVQVSNTRTANNEIVYPMLRKADIKDSTYEQYNPSVKQVLRNNKIIEGKNLLEYPYHETTITKLGITFTVNADKSITVNGTATAQCTFQIVDDNFHINDLLKYKGQQLIITGCPSGGSQTTYSILVQGLMQDGIGVHDYGNGVSVTPVDFSGFTTTRQIAIIIRNGVTVNNLVFKPMVRLATETDPTYEPCYIPGVVSQEAQNILGAKNLLGFESNRTEQNNGVTFNYDADTGCVTINGTNTSSSTGAWGTCTLKHFPKGRYKLSGLIKGDSVVTQIEFNSTDSSFGNHNIFSNGTDDFGGSFEITDDTKTYRISVRVEKSATANNIKIYPMLRLADVKDDTYTPYAKTNRELTNWVSEFIGLESQVTMLEQTHYSFETTAETRYIKIYNGYLIVRLSVTDLDIDSMPSGQTFTDVLSIPDKYTLLQSPRLTVVSDNNTSAKPIQMECSAHRLSLRGGTPNAHYSIYCLIPVRY